MVSDAPMTHPLSAELRARTKTGYSQPDPLCQKAADELDRMTVALREARNKALAEATAAIRALDFKRDALNNYIPPSKQDCIDAVRRIEKDTPND